MTKKYAAFYLPPEEKEVKLPNQKNVDRIKSSVSRALQNAKQSVLNFDVNAMARNMDLQSSTEFVQRYATGALTKIINGEPVTNKTMLDSLFNTYAPALNAGLAQTGFNSIVEMKNAAQAGNGSINVANFVQGFSDGLSIVQSAADKTDYRSKYGEEIPIDVVENLNYTYKLQKAEQKTSLNENNVDKYLSNLDPIKVILSAHVKNENAELWSVNDFTTKIVDLMANKQDFTVRLGKSIYENCVITSFNPIITSIYDIKFDADIVLNFNSVSKSYKQGGNHIMKQKPIVGDFDRLNNNRIASEVYLGIIS